MGILYVICHQKPLTYHAESIRAVAASIMRMVIFIMAVRGMPTFAMHMNN